MRDLDILREEIDIVSRDIIKYIAYRMKLAEEVADYKKANGLPVYVPEREKIVIENVRNVARAEGIPEDLAEKMFKDIMYYTVLMEDERNE